jgi:hypothetical protein
MQQQATAAPHFAEGAANETEPLISLSCGASPWSRTHGHVAVLVPPRPYAGAAAGRSRHLTACRPRDTQNR